MSCMNFKASRRLRCLLLVLVSNVAANRGTFPAIFNFGDSNSDTGACSTIFKLASEPNGLTFFGKPSGRLCDGRLIIDFIAEKLKMPYVSAYVDALETNFKHGANFAVSGTTIMPVNGETYAKGVIPIALNLQLLQFYRFKQRVLDLHTRQGETLRLENRLPKPEDFSKALYTLDIGQNDISLLDATASVDQAYTTLSDIINCFSLSIQQLYQLGGRHFLIHSTGPIGCLPNSVKSYPCDPKSTDEIGCIKPQNLLAQEFNRLLVAELTLLRTKLEDSSLVYADIYSAKYSLISDATQHGFTDALGNCCKGCIVGGGHYWNRTIADVLTDDVPAACEDPSKFISWDGVHYTDAANHWLANHIFDGSINDPLVKLSQNRNGNFIA